MDWLFDASGLATLRAFVDHATLFAFDLDGTLAPLVDGPSLIRIPDDVRGGLTRLSALAPVAIISGRACRDARAHLGFTPRFLVGNHGAEGLPGWEADEARFVELGRRWEQQMTRQLGATKGRGITCENKGTSLSYHYRRAKDREAAREALLKAASALTPPARLVAGHFVLNVVAPDAPNKGEALLALMEHAARHRAVFVGDDQTDEDVFASADENILGLRVGQAPGSLARYFLRGQREVGALIEELIAALESCRETDP